ncbi:TonB-dependent receptor [Sandaracinobacteroides hominis]|uniref:TonB-dependent receptor n=1 Tax=Sandaracinobacteroides hominis TaxID=2780086 RepID=UPI001F2C035B|nr:TonB-dependent receptor [Sandaracinobacteroides hominis]
MASFDRDTTVASGASGGGTRLLLSGASICVMAVSLLALPAHAQTAPGVAAAADAPASPGDGEEIVVTGLRAAATNARNIKKNAEVIVDSVTASDIGSLPDRSVSEALQRIPGVTLQRTNENRDPARLAAEGGGIFVRGLSWVRSELNGRDTFSASNGRSLSFEDISADLVAGVDVYKNPSADMIEGGVGGVVNLRTRKPLSERGQIIALSGDYNYGDLRGKGWFSGNALYSNKWDVSGGEFGILFSGSINNIGNRTDSIQLGRYEPLTPNATNATPNMVAGTTYYMPNSVGFRRIDWDQRRVALNGVVQVRPIPEMTFTFEGVYAKATPRDIENAVGSVTNPASMTNPNYKFDDRNVLVEGELTAEPLTFNTRYGKQDKVTQDYSINWSYDISDRFTISADVQRVHSTAKILSMTSFTQFGVKEGFYNGARPTISWETGGNSPSMTVTEAGAPLADKSNYWWAAAMDHIEDNEAGSWAQRADIDYRFDEGGFLKSLKAGVRFTQKNSITRQTGWNWALLSQQQWGGGPNAVFLDEQGNPPNGDLPNQVELFNYNNFFRGKIAVPTAGWFGTPDLVHNNVAAYDYLKSTLSAGWGWSPLTPASYETATGGADNVTGGITNQAEETKAAYALLRFGSPDSGERGTFDGNIGIRYVRTDNTATGTLIVNPVTNSLPACIAAHPGNPAACQPLAEAVAFTGGGGGIRLDDQSYKNKYENWLPTFNFRYFATDEVQLRFAIGQAMVRPNFAQMVPFNSLSFNFNSDGTPPAVAARTGTGGNPYLKPTIATQIDFSAEWYHGASNSLTIALFYKDIKDFVYAGVAQESFTNNGQTVTFDVTRNMNGPSGKVKGFELAAQQFADFLPGGWAGIGIQANYTFVDSTGGSNLAVNSLDPNQIVNADRPLPLEGMSKHSFNLAGMYEMFGISARLAYNWRSKYLLTTSAANLNAPVWFEDFGQLDGSLQYQFTKNLKAGIQITNLLNARTYLDVGGTDLHPRYSWTDTDRRIAFRANLLF